MAKDTGHRGRNILEISVHDGASRPNVAINRSQVLEQHSNGLELYKSDMHGDNQKVLVSLPRKLVTAIDVATTEKQVSRTAFIRESLIRNLHYYNKYERSPVCFPRDDLEWN
jgi:hypothetical protein